MASAPLETSPPSSPSSSLTGFPLAALPVDCLSVVFAHCSPRDICRFACVSTLCRAAAENEEAWRRVAPWLEQVSTTFSSLKDQGATPNRRFARVLEGIHSEDGSFMASADPETGRLSLHASVVNNLGIAWLDKDGTGHRYWTEDPKVAGSNFDTCAHLNSVCWFALEGQMKLPLLPAGRYSLAWKAAKQPRGFRWLDKPALCTATLARGSSTVENAPVDFNTDGQPFKVAFPFLDKGAPGELAQNHVPSASLQDNQISIGSSISTPVNTTGPGTEVSNAPAPSKVTEERVAVFPVRRVHRTRLPTVDMLRRPMGVMPGRGLGGEDGSRGWGGKSGSGWARPARAFEWTLYPVGEISHSGFGQAEEFMNLKVSLVEILTSWKQGLFLDSLVFTQCPPEELS